MKIIIFFSYFLFQLIYIQTKKYFLRFCPVTSRPKYGHSKTIEKKELDLFMFIGDNVYGDQEDGELDKLIRTYKKQYKNLENF